MTCVLHHPGLHLKSNNACFPYLSALKCGAQVGERISCVSEAFHADHFRGHFDTAPYETRGANDKRCYVEFTIDSKVKYKFKFMSVNTKQDNGVLVKHSTYSNYCTNDAEIRK